MTFEQALYERLQTIPALSFVPIYLDHRPQDATSLPVVEYEVPDFNSPTDLDGVTSTAEARATIRVLSATVTQAEAISLAIFRSLFGRSGVWSGIAVDYCTIEDQSADWANAPDGSDQGIYIIETTYVVSHSLES